MFVFPCAILFLRCPSQRDLLYVQVSGVTVLYVTVYLFIFMN